MSSLRNEGSESGLAEIKLNMNVSGSKGPTDVSMSARQIVKNIKNP